MTHTQRGEYWYGDDHADLRAELVRYSAANGYPASDFVDLKCACGGEFFHLLTDEDEGVGIRICADCEAEHVMGDSANSLDEAEPQHNECLCGEEVFQLTVGVNRYRVTEETLTDDVRWLYIGCRCIQCGLVGCYADWKNEAQDYRQLLSLM